MKYSYYYILRRYKKIKRIMSLHIMYFLDLTYYNKFSCVFVIVTFNM
jgi:hypothetical protein